MSTDASPIFDAAMGLPDSIRGDLAARLIASLDSSHPPVPERSHAEWLRILQERSAAIERGDAILVDGEDALARMREAVARARRTT
jgi:hypothetical protein